MICHTIFGSKKLLLIFNILSFFIISPEKCPSLFKNINYKEKKEKKKHEMKT